MSRRLALVVSLAGGCLVVTGLALLSVPVALIAAGGMIGAVGLFSETRR